MTLEQQFWARIREFLEHTRLSPTRFGRMALGDPNLLRQIESGRSLTLRTADRILAFVDEWESGGARDPPRRRRYRRPSPRAGRTRRSRKTTGQPTKERTNRPTRILRLPEIQARTGLSRTTIYEWRRAGRFPQPVPLGTRCVGWIEAEFEEWMDEWIEQGRGGEDAPAETRNPKEEKE